MATSEVQVCNIALKMLGADAITSLTEDSDRASLCNEFYAPARDDTLQDHEWNFAQVRVTLTKEVETPAWGFAFQYQLPTNPFCLRVNEVSPLETDYRVESNSDADGRKLVTDIEIEGIRYTARIVDVNLFSAQFVKCMALKLAAMMALPLTEDFRQTQLMEQKYKAQLLEARSIDSQEGGTRIAGPHADILLAVRRHGANTGWWDRSKRPFGF